MHSLWTASRSTLSLSLTHTHTHTLSMLERREQTSSITHECTHTIQYTHNTQSHTLFRYLPHTSPHTFPLSIFFFLKHAHTLSSSHSLTHTRTHTQTHAQTHTHSHAHRHSLPHTNTHTHTLARNVSFEHLFLGSLEANPLDEVGGSWQVNQERDRQTSVRLGLENSANVKIIFSLKVRKVWGPGSLQGQHWIKQQARLGGQLSAELAFRASHLAAPQSILCLSKIFVCGHRPKTKE